MREIVLDTETTGLDEAQGEHDEREDKHRIVEIGCVELHNHAPTGLIFQTYLNPERDMSIDAEKITGLTDAFLKDKPLFAAKVDEFLAFIGDCPLIIHNAAFDLAFLNYELGLLKKPPLKNPVIDTLQQAREKAQDLKINRFSLDALCGHFGIDNTNREKHGALLDAELLAEVYWQLVGGGQFAFASEAEKTTDQPQTQASAPAHSPRAPAAPQARPTRLRPTPLPSRLTETQHQAHIAFLENLPTTAKWLTPADQI